MNPTTLSTIHRLTSTAFPLPALCTTLGSALIADAVLCGLGTPAIPGLYQGSVGIAQGSLIISASVFGMLALAHVFVPCWIAIVRLACSIIPFLGWMVGPVMSFKADKYHYVIADVIRRVVEKDNKNANQLIAERRAEVEREQKLRLFAAALIVATGIDLCMPGSAARSVCGLLQHSNWLVNLCAIACAPAAVAAAVLAFFAFYGNEADSWIERSGLESLMEEPATSDRVAGPSLTMSPLARHARWPEASRS